MRAPAAVLLRPLTQKAKARQSCPPSPGPPPPSRLLGRRRGREGGGGAGALPARGRGRGRRAMGGACPGRCPAWFPRPGPARTEEQVVPVQVNISPHNGVTVTRTLRPVLLSLRLDDTSDPHRPPLSRRPGSAPEWASRPAHLGGLMRKSRCPRARQAWGLTPQGGVAPQGSLVSVCCKRSLPSRQLLTSSRAPPGHRVYPSPLTFCRLQWAYEQCATGRNLSPRPLGLVLEGVPSNLSHLRYHAEPEKRKTIKTPHSRWRWTRQAWRDVATRLTRTTSKYYITPFLALSHLAVELRNLPCEKSDQNGYKRVRRNDFATLKMAADSVRLCVARRGRPTRKAGLGRNPHTLAESGGRTQS